MYASAHYENERINARYSVYATFEDGSEATCRRNECRPHALSVPELGAHHDRLRRRPLHPRLGWPVDQAAGARACVPCSRRSPRVRRRLTTISTSLPASSPAEARQGSHRLSHRGLSGEDHTRRLGRRLSRHASSRQLTISNGTLIGGITPDVRMESLLVSPVFPTFDLAMIRIVAVATQLGPVAVLRQLSAGTADGLCADGRCDLLRPSGPACPDPAFRPRIPARSTSTWWSSTTPRWRLRRAGPGSGVVTNASLAGFLVGNVFLISHFYSFGDYHHTEAPLIIVLFVLTLSPSGRSLSVDSWLAGRNRKAATCSPTPARWRSGQSA